MKKILPIIGLIFLLLCAGVYQANARGACAAAGSGAGATACSNTTDYMGSKATTGGAAATLANDKIWCTLRTATATSGCTTGTVDTAFAYATENTTTDIMVCLYSSAGSALTPDHTGNTKLSCSALISNEAGGATWASAAMATAASVTIGSTYWVCHNNETSTWPYYRLASGPSLWSADCTNCQLAMPDNLDSTWTELANRDAAIYITIK